MLARATLKKIPGQLLNWMRKKGFKPNITADTAPKLVQADANIEEEKKE